MTLPGTLAPPFASPAHLQPILAQQGYAVLSPLGVCELMGCDGAALEGLRASWDDLPSDLYLKDGGKYRRRRHSCFVISDQSVEQVAHRAHWQPLEYNALHGGMQRWFEPVSPAVVQAPAWQALLLALARESSVNASRCRRVECAAAR